MERQAGAALEDVLSTKQIHYVLQQAVGARYQLLDATIRPAAQGLSGFLGDHFRVTFDVKVGESTKKVNIFVKSMPLSNEPKAKFIDEKNYYRREMIMFELFEKMQAYKDESNSWCAPAYICTDHILVMPDLLHRGYRQLPTLDCLDLKHILVTAASIARFHAAFANYETKRALDGQVPFSQEYADYLKEPTFKDSPWIRAAAKLTNNFLAAFSDKCDRYPANLEQVLTKLYIEACDTLTESDSLNVAVHKDLWVNNIMFKYEGATPVNAVLIDFQCVRYAPPAFDLMIFIYLTTSRSFRKRYEATIFRHYYVIFSESVDERTKARLQTLGYDFDDFVGWCHRARMFGVLEAVGIFPYVLMEPSAAQRTFDEAESFVRMCDEDRSAPVVAHARDHARYRLRQLELCEEFVERYVLNAVDQ